MRLLQARAWRVSLALALTGFGAACSEGTVETTHVPRQCSFEPGDATLADTHGLRINEVMTANDGAWVDEAGQTDDFIELVNTSDHAISLSDFALSDKPGKATALPEVMVEA